MNRYIQILTSSFYNKYVTILFIATPSSFPFLSFNQLPHRIITIFLIINFLLQQDLLQRLKSSVKNKTFWVCLGLFLLPLFWAPFSDRGATFFSIEKLLSFPIYALILFCYPPKMNLIYKGIWMLSITLSVIFMISLIHRIYYLYVEFFMQAPSLSVAIEGLNKTYWWNKFTHLSLMSFFRAHPSYLGMYITFTVFYLAFTLNETLATKKKYSVVLISILLMFQLLLAAKMAIITTIICFLIWAGFEIVVNKKWLLGLIVVSTIAICTLLVNLYLPAVKDRFTVNYRMFLENDQKLSEENVASQRIFVWSCSIRGILEKPVFGHGPGAAQLYLNDCARDQSLTRTLNQNAHNQFLQTTLSFGLVGLIVILTYFLVGSIQATHCNNKIFFAFLVITMLSFQTESMLSRQMGITFFCFFFTSFLANFARNYRDKYEFK